jgi:tetratricopeptide (TPR) repeat protein
MATMIRCLCVLMACALLMSLAAAQPPGTLSAAEEAYLSGDYAAAIAGFEGVIAASIDDARVYHNLGNAYFESGDLGRALLNFQRALRLDPRNGETSLQVSRVRGLRVDVQGDERDLLEVIAGTTDGILTTGELVFAAGLVWAAFFGLLTAYIVRPREPLRYALIGLGAAALIGLVLTAGRVYVEGSRPLAVVVQPQITVMSGPGESHISLYDLYAAAELRITAASGDWVQFALPDGRLGWARASEIERV